MIRHFRYAVIGAGGIGSAAAYWLSRAAAGDVVCLEQWTLGHTRGASEDHSRIIRLGYHAPEYTALARDAYAAWDVIASESGIPLVHKIGMINLAEPGTEGAQILDNYAAAMSAHDIPYERLDGAAVTQRWPQFRIEPDRLAVFQADGGILDIRKAVAAQLALARANGATVVPRAEVVGVDTSGENVVLQTPAGEFSAAQVVVCAGAWTARLLATQLGVHLPIRLTKEQVTYFATSRLREFAPDRFPIWIWHGDEEFYGFPVYGEVATKAGWEVCDPEVGLDDSSWEPDPDRVRHLAAFLDRILPGYTGPELYTRCCLYDLPPDRGFVLDRVPGHPAFTVAIGAGHAAKFAALFGRVLAELTVDGVTRYPVEAFRADRPALTDPDFVPGYRLGAPT